MLQTLVNQKEAPKNTHAASPVKISEFLPLTQNLVTALFVNTGIIFCIPKRIRKAGPEICLDDAFYKLSS